MADNDNGTSSKEDVQNNNRADQRQPNEGQAARRAQIREGDEFAIAGNARERGEDPSPDDRGRGETSIKDPAAPVDIKR